MTKSYLEVMKFSEYTDRLEYLKLLDNNAASPRHMSIEFYKSEIWKQIRNQVIRRDRRFDLGIFGLYIDGPVFVHHINPISEEDIINRTTKLTSLDNLICTSLNTHNAIHYRAEQEQYIERQPGDTILW